MYACILGAVLLHVLNKTKLILICALFMYLYNRNASINLLNEFLQHVFNMSTYMCSCYCIDDFHKIV